MRVAGAGPGARRYPVGALKLSSRATPAWKDELKMAVREIEPILLELDRLEQLAESGYYNPYTMFDWPEAIEPDKPWMSESLTTLAGTPMWDELTREQQIALTKYEAINFFSLNIHGIRELLSEVVLR